MSEKYTKTSIENADGEWLGNHLKFLVSITCENFSMADDDFRITFRNRRTRTEISLKKSDLTQDSEGNFYAILDTSKIGAGKVALITEADVPDSDFPDGIRKEFAKIELCEIHPL